MNLPNSRPVVHKLERRLQLKCNECLGLQGLSEQSVLIDLMVLQNTFFISSVALQRLVPS